MWIEMQSIVVEACITQNKFAVVPINAVSTSFFFNNNDDERSVVRHRTRWSDETTSDHNMYSQGHSIRKNVTTSLELLQIVATNNKDRVDSITRTARGQAATISPQTTTATTKQTRRCPPRP